MQVILGDVPEDSDEKRVRLDMAEVENEERRDRSERRWGKVRGGEEIRKVLQPQLLNRQNFSLKESLEHTGRFYEITDNMLMKMTEVAPNIMKSVNITDRCNSCTYKFFYLVTSVT